MNLHNKLIIMEEYSQQNEDKFVEGLKHSKEKVSALRSLSNGLTTCPSQKLVRKTPKEADKMMKQRFGSHIKQLRKQIGQVEDHCQKFGGKQFIHAELRKNEISPQDYAQYCISRVSSNFEFPKIEIRSQSLKHLPKSQSQTERRPKACYNKWYINPEERFSKSKERTKYDWSKPQFMLNIVKERGNVIEHRYIPKFINHLKESLDRQPLMCKYTIIKQKQ